MSSFEEDATRANLDAKELLVVGESTRADVLRVLGPPSGKSVLSSYGLIQDPLPEATQVYWSWWSESIWVKGEDTETGSVRVAFDAAGRVIGISTVQSIME